MKIHNTSKTIIINPPKRRIRKKSKPIPQICLKTVHLTNLFNDGKMDIGDATFFAALGYNFIMEAGGYCLAIIPPKSIPLRGEEVIMTATEIINRANRGNKEGLNYE